MNEVWKDIAGYEGFYQVSSWGRIKSLARIAPFGVFKRTLPEKILKPNNDKDGYERICLVDNNGVKRNKIVHRLLAIAFIPNPLNKRTVNHIDAVKNNNHVSNLEWATQSEQNFHYIKIGNGNHVNRLRGKDSPKARPIKQLTLTGELVKVWDCAVDVQAGGFRSNSVTRVVNGWSNS